MSFINLYPWTDFSEVVDKAIMDNDLLDNDSVSGFVDRCALVQCQGIVNHCLAS